MIRGRVHARETFYVYERREGPGWLLIHEHARDSGTLVRVRRHGAELPDRREG